MDREEMSRLKAFLHDDLMKEHSVGSALKRMVWISQLGDGREQALTDERGSTTAPIRVAPREKI